MNEEVKKHIENCDELVIVTSCSKPLVNPFINYFFRTKKKKIFASTLVERNGFFTGNLSLKITPKVKRQLVLEYFKSKTYSFDDTIAFGNYPQDKYMLKLFKRHNFL